MHWLPRTVLGRQRPQGLPQTGSYTTAVHTVSRAARLPGSPSQKNLLLPRPARPVQARVGPAVGARGSSGRLARNARNLFAFPLPGQPLPPSTGARLHAATGTYPPRSSVSSDWEPESGAALSGARGGRPLPTARTLALPGRPGRVRARAAGSQPGQALVMRRGPLGVPGAPAPLHRPALLSLKPRGAGGGAQAAALFVWEFACLDSEHTATWGQLCGCLEEPAGAGLGEGWIGGGVERLANLPALYCSRPTGPHLQ